MSVLEQTARMAPREAALTDKRTAELASTLRLVAQSEILLGKPDLSLPIVRRDLMELAERVEGMAPSVAQQFAALGLTCTTVEEAAQAIEALSALARTEAAAKAGAIVERDAYNAMLEAENARLGSELAKDYVDRMALSKIEVVDGKVQIAIEDAKSVMRDFFMAAVAILDDSNATNYVEMEAGFKERPTERFALVLQRVGKLTPHSARLVAEKDRDELRALIAEVVACGATPWATVTVDIPVRRDLWDRLVAAARTTEGA